MNRDDIIKMASKTDFFANAYEGGFFDRMYYEGNLSEVIEDLTAFAVLVAAAEREKVASWMMKRGYSTGHGDTIEDLLQELDWQIVDNWTRAMMNGVTTEREMCAKIVDRWYDGPSSEPEMAEIAAEIRARGNSEKP